MSEENESNKTFHLGLTMAGAVSAGAYTGGVMDYLFEVLDKWDKAKKGELDGVDESLVPGHNVVIDAIGGTSAGGMTTVMSALYAIKGDINPVTDAHKGTIGGKRNNIFYDSWINLVDEPNTKTMEKALSTDDLERYKKIYSALNSDFIDQIAEKAFQLDDSPHTNPVAKLPGYISKHLEMLISHTMLRGIPLEVSFATPANSLKDAPSHVSYEHFLFSHFKLNNGNPVQEGDCFWLNPYQDNIKAHLLKATMATGAFPVGLRYREFDKDNFGEEYLKTVVSRLIKGDMGETPPELRTKIDWEDKVLKSILQDYLSISVDGGAINNEPYGEVLSILKTKNKKPVEKVDGHPYQKYGIVMIDPFPDFPEMRKDYKHPDDLLKVIPGTIGTLKDQAKIKRRDMMNQFSEKSYRGVIFPVKHKPGAGNGKYDYPIASASLGAFGGFLDIRFRHHDFYLGRNNARNFVRAFLSMPYRPDEQIIHPIHREWSQPMIDKFLITLKDGSTYLPVIPDMNMILDDVDSKDEAYTYSIPSFPKMTEEEVEGLKPHIRNRVKGLMDTVESSYFKPAEIRGNIFERIKRKAKRWFTNKLKKKIKTAIAEGSADKAVDYITEDLTNRGLM